MSIFFEFFIKPGWTKTGLGIIFYALFVFSALSGEHPQNVFPRADDSGENGFDPVPDELEILKGESALLRRELSEVLLKYSELSEKLLKYEIGVASASHGWPADRAVGQAISMIEYFDNMRKLSGELKESVSELEVFVKKILDKDSPDDTDKARIRARLQDIVESSARLAELAGGFSSEKSLETCRVIAVEDRLQVVAIDAGSMSGTRCGMLCRAVSASGEETVMKVVAVRPFVSAAMVIKGDIRNLLPGMNVKIGTVN